MKTCEISVSFNPKPAQPPAVPCAVLVRAKRVGELIAYDNNTGIGRARIHDDVTLKDFLFLTVAGYAYKDMKMIDLEGKNTTIS